MKPLSKSTAFGRATAACAGGMLLLHLLAFAFPGTFWGIDFHTFLPITYLLVASAVAWGITWAMPRIPFPKRIPTYVAAAGIAIVMGFIYHALPIRTALYGDSHSILKTLAPGGAFFDQYQFTGAFSPNIFTSKNGEQFTYSLVAGLTHGPGWKVADAFQLISSVFGGMFVFVWMWFVLEKVKGNGSRLVAAGMCLTAGATQVFFGHVEVYAAPMALMTAYLLALAHYLETRQRTWFWMLIPLWLLAVRSHSAGFVLGPSLAYAGLAYAGAEKWLRWRSGGALLLGLCLLAGIAGYIFRFGAGDDRIATSSKAGNMFLTPLGDATPDNAYYLLSGWHIWDLSQEALLCGSAAIALLIASLLAAGRSARWSSPAIIGTAISAILMMALYFAIDPLLTMPRDWDLFAMMAPPLLALALVVFSRTEEILWWQQALPLTVGAWQLAFVSVNQSPNQVHLRQLAVAEHVFQSGDVGGSFLMARAVEAIPLNLPQKIELLDRSISAVTPYQSKANAADFAYLNQFGGTMSFQLGDYKLALKFYEAENRLEPGITSTLEDLAVTEHYLGHPANALRYAQEAMRSGSRRSNIWVLGFLSASAMQQYPLALQIGDDYLSRFGDPDGLGAEVEKLRASMRPQ